MPRPVFAEHDRIRWRFDGETHEGVVVSVLSGQYVVDDGSGNHVFLFKRDYTLEKVEEEGT